MKKVLVVDDEISIVTLLKYNLEKENYEVTTVDDGQDALKQGLTNNYDFIILDLMLPSLNGIEVVKKLRQEKIETPILILTAKDDEYDKVIGLELGADDYLTKPFSPREVIARLKAIARRVSRVQKVEQQNRIKEESKYIFGQFKVDRDKYLLLKNEEIVKLTPKEIELLMYFLEKRGKALSRDELLNHVWGFDFIGQTRIVDMHVSHLREKIEENAKMPKYIKTVRGFGYRFDGDDNE